MANKKPIIAFKDPTGFYVQNSMIPFIVHTHIATTRMPESVVAFNKAAKRPGLPSPFLINDANFNFYAAAPVAK